MATRRVVVSFLWHGHSDHGVLQGLDACGTSSIQPRRHGLPHREIGIKFDVAKRWTPRSTPLVPLTRMGAYATFSGQVHTSQRQLELMMAFQKAKALQEAEKSVARSEERRV